MKTEGLIPLIPHIHDTPPASNFRGHEIIRVSQSPKVYGLATREAELKVMCLSEAVFTGSREGRTLKAWHNLRTNMRLQWELSPLPELQIQ